ncbi:hypothetical protein XELAEV_18001462mg [Xenopus laevis]|nr:hypothetical protein XELAEV_18001462mg [Xenopus laevis]
MIYLLTGEHYIPRKKSDDGGALHAPGSVIQKENNKNDKKILELMSNIIQLLTGEVAIRTHHVSIYFSLDEWDYIKGNKDLYEEGMKEEEPQQLRPLDSEYEDTRDITADLGGTLCYNNETSKIGAEGAAFCANGSPTNPEISPLEQPPPANEIKEKLASYEEGNQSDCSINPLAEQIQGTDTPTPIMECSLNNSLAANYILNGINEQSASWEESNQSDCSINPLTEQIQGTDTPTPIMGCSLNNSLSHNYILNGINEQSASWEESNQSDCSINPLTEPIQGTDTPTPIMECSLSDTVPGIQNNGRRSNNMRGTCELQRLYKCSECYRIFSIKSTFERHQRRSHKKLVSSSKDGKLMAHSSDLKERKSNRNKSFTCSECGKCFKRRSNLTKGFHTGEKPFSCSECGKCFAQVSDLNLHNRTHTGEKPFSCSECGKCFKQSSHLRAHLISHTEEKPYSCSECGNCFKHRADLLRHRRIHMRENPFACSLCGQTFNRSSLLSKHKKWHSGEKLFSCSDTKTGLEIRCSTLSNELLESSLIVAELRTQSEEQ